MFTFEGPNAYADRQVWSLLEGKLLELRKAGATSVSMLDAGCGPGTWLCRLASRARQLESTTITARGFDIAAAQIGAARRAGRDLATKDGVRLTFEEADITAGLLETDGSVDIAICLFSVLSHLPAWSLSRVVAEIARVTRGYFVTTVRSVGSPPTVFVDSIEKATRFRLDHRLDRCEVDFDDERRLMLSFHLFAASELRDLLARYFQTEDLRGLDIFHDRFKPDRRWNPATHVLDESLSGHLARLGEIYARDPSFMDCATHLMFVGKSQSR